MSFGGTAGGEPWSWPALALGEDRPPPVLECERAVWGKAHGVATDYRWLARSPGFAIDRRPELELNAGLEDRPTRAFFWRVTERVWAVAGYRSRAVDAAGRSGFFEKQVLEWRSPAGPRAAGALFLLERAAALDDGVWWSRRDGEGWVDADFTLELAAAELPRLSFGAADLARKIEAACGALRESVSESALAAFYSRLLDGPGPALLARDEPLPATALAALLLPLPRSVADGLSLAGWLPSRRAADPHELAARWQGLVIPGATAIAESSSLGRAMARAIFAGDPEGLPVEPPAAAARDRPAASRDGRDRPAAAPRAEPPPAPAEPSPRSETGGTETPSSTFPVGWPRHQLPLTPPPAGASATIRLLFSFAASTRRRWLDPQDLVSMLGGPLTALVAPGEQRLLTRWIDEVETQRPEAAHAGQWAVKVDLLRVAALALIPAPEASAGAGLPTTGRVPALGYAVHLRPEAFAALRRAYNREVWDRLVSHSVEGCPRDQRWSAEVRERLASLSRASSAGPA